MISTRGRMLLSSWSVRALVFAAAIALSWTLFQHLIDAELSPNGDAQAAIVHWEAARTSFARGQGFPLWNRAECGGIPFLGDPSAPLLSSLLVGLFGIHGDVMLRWYLVSAVVVGALGVYAWCRSAHGLSRLSSAFAGGLLFAGNYVSLQLIARPHLASIALLPWVLYLGHRAQKDLRRALLAGSLLALMILEGGLVVATLAMLALVLVELPAALRDPLAELKTLGVCLAVCLLVAGVKLYPVLAQIIRHPRPAEEADVVQWTHFIPMLIDSDRVEALPGLRHSWADYRAYLGPIASGSAIAGAGAALVVRPRRLGVACLLFGGLALMMSRVGEGAWFLDAPPRFMLLVQLALAVCSAIAVESALGVLRRKKIRFVVVAGAFLALCDPLWTARKVEKTMVTEPWLPRPDPTAQDYRLLATQNPRLIDLPARNLGSTSCRKDAPRGPGAVITPDDKAQVSLEDPGAGSIGAVATMQNTYVIDADLRRPGALLINQAFDADWQANVGVVRKNGRGGIALILPAGRHHLTLAYRPRGLVPGVIVTTLGVIGIGVWAVVMRRRKARPAKVAAPAT